MFSQQYKKGLGVGGIQKVPVNSYHSHTSPLGVQFRNIGKTSSQWELAPVMDSAFKQFGQNLDMRLAHQQLQPVPHGSSAGIQYGASIRNTYDYLKNPRGADGTVMTDNSAGNLNVVEKNM